MSEFKTIEEASAAGMMAWWMPLVKGEYVRETDYQKYRPGEWFLCDNQENIIYVNNGTRTYRRLVVAPEGAPDPGEGFRLLERKADGYEGELYLDGDSIYGIMSKTWREVSYRLPTRCQHDWIRRKLDPAVQDVESQWDESGEQCRKCEHRCTCRMEQYHLVSFDCETFEFDPAVQDVEEQDENPEDDSWLRPELVDGTGFKGIGKILAKPKPMQWWRPLVDNVDTIRDTDEFDGNDRYSKCPEDPSHWIQHGHTTITEACGMVGKIYKHGFQTCKLTRRLVVAPEGAPYPGEGYRLLERKMDGFEGEKVIKGDQLLTGKCVWVDAFVGASPYCATGWIRRKLDPAVQDATRDEILNADMSKIREKGHVVEFKTVETKESIEELCGILEENAPQEPTSTRSSEANALVKKYQASAVCKKADPACDGMVIDCTESIFRTKAMTIGSDTVLKVFEMSQNLPHGSRCVIDGIEFEITRKKD